MRTAHSLIVKVRILCTLVVYLLLFSVALSFAVKQTDSQLTKNCPKELYFAKKLKHWTRSGNRQNRQVVSK